MASLSAPRGALPAASARPRPARPALARAAAAKAPATYTPPSQRIAANELQSLSRWAGRARGRGGRGGGARSGGRAARRRLARARCAAALTWRAQPLPRPPPPPPPSVSNVVPDTLLLEAPVVPKAATVSAQVLKGVLASGQLGLKPFSVRGTGLGGGAGALPLARARARCLAPFLGRRAPPRHAASASTSRAQRHHARTPPPTPQNAIESSLTYDKCLALTGAARATCQLDKALANVRPAGRGGGAPRRPPRRRARTPRALAPTRARGRPAHPARPPSPRRAAGRQHAGAAGGGPRRDGARPAPGQRQGCALKTRGAGGRRPARREDGA